MLGSKITNIHHVSKPPPPTNDLNIRPDPIQFHSAFQNWGWPPTALFAQAVAVADKSEGADKHGDGVAGYRPNHVQQALRAFRPAYLRLNISH